MKLALGTAQLGLPYGITNKNGQVSRDNAREILNLARKNMMDTLDTAISYGESETCLGQVGVNSFKVVTKLPAIPEEIKDIALWVRTEVQGSLKRLNLSSIYGLLLHSPQQLCGPKGEDLAKSLEYLKSEGIVKKIGASIYAPSELDSIMSVFNADLIQAPFSLVDRRLFTSGWMHKLHACGVELHIRSVFLQGLLLMSREDIPKKFNAWARLWDRWHEWLRDNDIPADQACISFVQEFSQVDKVVTGVENAQQLNQLTQSAKYPKKAVWPDLSCLDEYLINPSNWNLL
ncbi:MAG: aldo/keto reductase [Bdellovibrionales bacterium]|nr:aldo/keto reductase [Bdellovibrionales bacterium]MBT3525229.1 aldo/keto reductase [Bdellovibrionales bacterium]MBT7668245.1 aldo/keto reductase [Bdellovibrionales bacterium]